MTQDTKPGKSWYLLPIFLLLLGGLIMFLTLRKEAPRMARNGLVLGILMTVLGSVVGTVFFASYVGTVNDIQQGITPGDVMIGSTPFADSTGYTPQWAASMGPSTASLTCSDKYVDGSLTARDDRWCTELSSYIIDVAIGNLER